MFLTFFGVEFQERVRLLEVSKTYDENGLEEEEEFETEENYDQDQNDESFGNGFFYLQ